MVMILYKYCTRDKDSSLSRGRVHLARTQIPEKLAALATPLHAPSTPSQAVFLEQEPPDTPLAESVSLEWPLGIRENASGMRMRLSLVLNINGGEALRTSWALLRHKNYQLPLVSRGNRLRERYHVTLTGEVFSYSYPGDKNIVI